MNKLENLLIKKGKQEEEKLNRIREEIRKEVEAEIKNTNKETAIVIVEDNIKDLLKIEDLENIEVLDEITEDAELNKKLKEKALEFVNFSAKTNIWLGKHLTEVFNLLSTGNPKEESSYLKYLSYININERTARRYRKRYKIYESLPMEEAKKLILTLSDNDIQLLDEEPKLLAQLDRGLTKEEFKNLKENFLLENAEQLPLEPKIANIPELPKLSIEEIGVKIENLYLEILPKRKNIPEEKLELLEKYLDKITKLLAE